MNLALTLDNSFEIMNDDEMYDVNGGGKLKWYHKAAIIGAVLGSIAILTVAIATGTLCSLQLSLKLQCQHLLQRQ